MPSYRMFLMGDGRRIVGPPTDFDAATDDEAVEQARQMLDGHDVEVWQRERFITRLSHQADE